MSLFDVLGPGGTFHVEVDAIDATGPLRIPNTRGWQLWRDVATTVTLASGTHVLRIAIDAAGTSGAVGNLLTRSVRPRIRTAPDKQGGRSL